MNQESTNETAQPSPLNRWIIEHGERVAAVKDACAALARHLSCPPDPQTTEETATFLSWRYQQFRVRAEPINSERIRIAANATGEVIDDARNSIIQAARQLLTNIERLMGIDARNHANGLFSPAELPKQAVTIRGEHAFVAIPALPADSPPRSIGHDPRLPEICIGRVFRVHSFDGVVHTAFEPWLTVESIRREVTAARAERDRQDEARSRAAEEQRQREKDEELRHLSLEQRQIRSLESQLAEVQAKLAAV